MSAKIESGVEKDGGFVSVTIEHDVGDPDCKHDWNESKLLFVKCCDKCGRIEDYNG